MKIRRNLQKIKRALITVGRMEEAFMVECAAMPTQKVCRLVDYDNNKAPYFSIIILHGQGRAP